MLAPLITFITSSAGGALVGLIQTFLEQRRHDRIRKEERDHQRELSHNQHSADMYSRSVEAAQIKPIRYVYQKTQTRLKWFFFGKPFECVTKVEKDKLSQTPRERMSAVIVLLVMSTYCICCLWVGIWIFADFSIVSPGSKQSGFSLLGLINLSWGGNKAVSQSGLSSLLYMLSPLIFIGSNWIIRKFNR